MTEQTKFEHWCIVELFGHQRIAGLVTEESLFGGTLLRVDVPATEASAPFTKYYGNSAIYAITPVSEEVATAIAKSLNQRPVSQWEVPTKLISANVDPEPVYEPDDSYGDGRDYDSEDDSLF